MALHAPLADAAPQAAAQGVGTAGAVRLVLGGGGRPPGQQDLYLVEGLAVDDQRVHDVLGPDPLAGLVPAHLGDVAEGDVVDVEQHLVFALLVPDLVTGVARIGQDGTDGELVPGDAAAVPVTSGVVRGRARDTVAGEHLGDGVDAVPGEEQGEDPAHHRRRFGGEVEPVQPLAVRGLGRVGVRARVREQVPVRRASAQESALHAGEGFHSGADADLDPVAFGLAHPSEHAHHHVVGFVGGVDRPAHLGHPQRHLVL